MSGIRRQAVACEKTAIADAFSVDALAGNGKITCTGGSQGPAGSNTPCVAVNVTSNQADSTLNVCDLPPDGSPRVPGSGGFSSRQTVPGTGMLCGNTITSAAVNGPVTIVGPAWLGS